MKPFRLGSPLTLICGAVTSLFAVSLPLTLMIVLFGELGRPAAALNGVLFLSVLSLFAFFFLNRYFHRGDGKNTFALSYYAFFALWSSVFLFGILSSDLTYVFDSSAALTRSVLFGGFSRLLLVHALALLVLIGREVVRYVRSLRR